MKALHVRWQQWSAQFLARPRRERAILAAALVFGGGFLLFNFAVDPALRAGQAARAETAAARAEMALQQTQLAQLNALPDADAANRQKLTRLKDELNEVNARLASFEQGMVPPARMRDFLRDLLARNRGIELLELKTLPPQPVAAPATTAAAASAPATGGAHAQDDSAVIWQHGIELKLAGRYNDLLGTLGELEGMRERLLWNSASLTVEKYPRNILVLRVYTLSLDRNWLEM
ncbi:MAG: hypothetical protein CVU17_11310 [Betaproteobacteria bacterium HGW-Betaproteobacteria-11]|nr:MAG: hypothetical protein CVU17_11310 [Betaproteobacteria bacterium HGW-Betaproteobacteria-11]